MRSAAESDKVLLIHIQSSIENIRQYTGVKRDTFFGSQLVQDAVLRNLQTLAESTQRLSKPLKATEPGIPWQEIAGFRNVLTHSYLGLDLDVIWNVLEHDLDALSEAVERMTQFIEGDVSS